MANTESKVLTRYEATSTQHEATLARLNQKQAAFSAAATGSMAKIGTSLDASSAKAESFGMQVNKAVSSIKAASFITAFAQIQGAIALVSGAIDGLSKLLNINAVNWEKVRDEAQATHNQWKKNLEERTDYGFGGKKVDLAGLSMATGMSYAEMAALGSGRSYGGGGAITGGSFQLSPEEQSAVKEYFSSKGFGDYVTNAWDAATRAVDKHRKASSAYLGSADYKEIQRLNKIEAGYNLMIPGRGDAARMSPGAFRGSLGASDPTSFGGYETNDSEWQNFLQQQDADSMAERYESEQQALMNLTLTMQTFGAAAAEGFGAWIDGSKAFGEAFKQAFAASLRATAMDMLGKSIYHAAAAIGALAIGGPLASMTAAQHGKAAAAYGTGAIAVGALGRGLYAAGWGGGGGSGGGGGGAPNFASGGPGAGGSPINVFVGDDWAEDSANARQRRIYKGVSTAMKMGATGQGGGLYFG